MINQLSTLLLQYKKNWLDKETLLDCQRTQQKYFEKISDFVNKNHDCFLRTNLKGHITGSALVVDPGFQKTLLTHHKKLNKWLQLGGHADGDSDIAGVALKEAQEESGLEQLSLLYTYPFDLDIHEIPEHNGVPTHLHYDIRFIVVANGDLTFQVSEESKNLAWVTLEEALKLADEKSMHRQIRKLEFIRKNRSY